MKHKAKLKTPIIPVSRWDERGADLWPFTTSAAIHLCNSFKKQLVKAGALTRVGRERLIRVKPYKNWLFNAANQRRVETYMKSETTRAIRK